jgi:hypothetical protein
LLAESLYNGFKQHPIPVCTSSLLASSISIHSFILARKPGPGQSSVVLPDEEASAPGHLASLSVSHYVVEVIDHRYQHALDMMINLLDDLMTAVRPSDGCKPE